MDGIPGSVDGLAHAVLLTGSVGQNVTTGLPDGVLADRTVAIPAAGLRASLGRRPVITAPALLKNARRIMPADMPNSCRSPDNVQTWRTGRPHPDSAS